MQLTFDAMKELVDQNPNVYQYRVDSTVEEISKEISEDINDKYKFDNRKLWFNSVYPESEAVPADEILVARGNVVDAIMDTVDAKKCDMIVMGHHIRSTLGETFLGSTTRRVLRRSRIPVLLVPLPEGE